MDLWNTSKGVLSRKSPFLGYFSTNMLVNFVVIVSGEWQHLYISRTCENGLTSIYHEELPSLRRSTYELVHSSDPYGSGVSAFHEYNTQVTFSSSTSSGRSALGDVCLEMPLMNLTLTRIGDGLFQDDAS
jgi:hypothetical protein